MRLLMQFMGVIVILGMVFSTAAILEKVIVSCQRRHFRGLPPPDKATARNSTQAVP